MKKQMPHPTSRKMEEDQLNKKNKEQENNVETPIPPDHTISQALDKKAPRRHSEPKTDSTPRA
jgi:hypothetical protein